MPTPTTAPPLAELEYRYERKYHAWDASPRSLDLKLKLHPAHFVDAYPPRWVNNIYLDSPSLSNFASHVSGQPRRAKLRIRWYGEAHQRVERPVLEVKIKRGEVGTKLHYPLDPFDFDGCFDVEAVRRAARGAGEQAALLLRVAEPALFNRYHRRYYCTSDRRFRVTLDTEMSFHVVNRMVWGPLTEYRERRLSILEFKYDVNDDDLASDVPAHLPFLLGKNSKYVYGIERLRGLPS